MLLKCADLGFYIWALVTEWLIYGFSFAINEAVQNYSHHTLKYVAVVGVNTRQFVYTALCVLVSIPHGYTAPFSIITLPCMLRAHFSCLSISICSPRANTFSEAFLSHLFFHWSIKFTVVRDQPSNADRKHTVQSSLVNTAANIRA